MRTLIIAEKPSVARDIARVLGAREKGEGFLVGEQYIISWAVGHLVTLCEPDEINEAYKKWREQDLPIIPEVIPTKVIPKTKSQFSILKKLLNAPDVKDVICATDSGREGELIFRYIYAQAKCKKPVMRLWISSMTNAAIRDGFAKLKPSADYDALYQSARLRSEADWLVGMNASRAFTLKYGVLLSLGRVQTPTLKLIVDRDLEIKNFVPEDYHEVRADFSAYEGLWVDPNKLDTRCRDKELAQKLKCQLPGKTGIVTESNREEKSMPAPQLFDLTTLQREVNRVMGLSAAKTLEIAQALYEKHKLITYPRTDSRYLSRDMIGKVQKTLGTLPEPYASFAQPLMPKPPVSGRVYNDNKVTDHHAIVPTGQYNALLKLNEQEKRVFDMVARRLIAVHYPDYVYESTIIKTQVDEHVFKTMGQTPKREGWRALYRDDKQNESQVQLPMVPVGSEFEVKAVSLKALKTKPPAPHTDATLLGMMERAGKTLEDESLKESMKDSGLGTPATRAATIERLIQVGYVTRKGKALSATDKGIRLIAAVPMEIATPEMTGKWEKALSVIARETDTGALMGRAERFIESIRRYAAFLVQSAQTADTGIQFEPEARKGGKGGKRKQSSSTSLGRPCPLCKTGEVTANAKAFGCSAWKEGCKFTVWRNQLTRQGGPEIGVNDMKKLLDGKNVSSAQGDIQMEQGIIKFTKK